MNKAFIPVTNNYLCVITSRDEYRIANCCDFREAMTQLATGLNTTYNESIINTEIFEDAISTANSKKECIELFNKLSSVKIKRIYVVSDVIYSDEPTTIITLTEKE